MNRFTGIVALCAAVLGAAGPAGDQLDQLAIVVHADVPIDDLPLERLRRLYLGDQQYWPDGSRVIVLIHAPGTVERQRALSTLFRMTESQYKQFWVARIFRGETTSGPRLVRDRAALPVLLASVPGTIALVQLRHVQPGMKVLTVDGRQPGAPGYLGKQ